MSSKPAFLIYGVLITFAVVACSRVGGPQPGAYRAVIALDGGEVPLQLRVDTTHSITELWVVEDDAAAQAIDLQITGTELQARLPNELGNLKVHFDRNTLNGELRLPAVEGEQRFPFTAQRDEHYRFFKDSLSDNADVSGTWRLDLGSSSELVSLTQAFDSVDGRIKLHDAPCEISGQVHNDDVYLAMFCKAAYWLLKGHVNGQGELEGDAWRNHDAAIHWLARRSAEPAVSLEDSSRHVTLPWAVPTR